MNLKIRLAFTGLIILGLGILLIAPTQAVVDEKEHKSEEESEIRRNLVLPRERGMPECNLKEPETAKYAPGEVLVGLKEGASIEDILKDASIEPTSSGRIHNTKPAVNKFKKTLKLEKDKEGYYWFLGKNYKEIEDIADATLFKEASKTMSEVEKKLYLSYKIKLPEGTSVEEGVVKLKENPDVEYAQPNYLVEAFSVPNDPYYHSQGSWGQPYDDLWGLKKIQCEGAWDISQGEGVVVAVVDTGLDYNHPDIAENVYTNPNEIPGNGLDDDGNGFIDDVRGWDFANGDNNPIDGHGHGTHVSGTIAAVGNNGIGVIGVAPKAKIMPLKGLDDKGSGYADNLSDAIIYAADNGADVINNSWGCSSGCLSNPVVEEAVRYAHGLGAVVVFAAGNAELPVGLFSPQNQPETIVVSAFDQNDQKTSFTNFGLKVDVAAPGGGAWSTITTEGFYKEVMNILSLRSSLSDSTLPSTLYVGDRYLRLAGTSMAAPHVAGLAALILSRNPELTNEEVRQILRVSADDVAAPGSDLFAGAGRINATEALTVDSALQVYISSPSCRLDVSHLESVEIRGTAAGPDFASYELSYGLGFSPSDWVPIGSPSATPVVDGLLGTFSPRLLDSGGIYTLRLVAVDAIGRRFETYTEIFNSLKEEWVRPLTTIYTPRPDSFPQVRISGDKVVWADFRNGNFDIYLYDLTTNTERQITTDAADQYSPAISGDKVVWVDSRNGNCDIYLYDLTTNTERQITTDAADQINPAISGDKIIWEDERSNNRDIYLYDLLINNERQISMDTNLDFQYNPAISGDKIVWEHDDDMQLSGLYLKPQSVDIYFYDLLTDTQQRITTDPLRDEVVPHISGDKVVWTGCPLSSFNFDVEFYNLTTQTGQCITTDPEWQMLPRISGDTIVWLDFRNGNGDIYLYDLLTNTERPITTNPAYQVYPDISGDRVVWVDFRKNGYPGIPEIFLYDPPSPPAFDSIDDKSINEGELLQFTVTAKDSDGDIPSLIARLATGEFLEIIGATFTDHEDGSGTFSWTPSYEQAGTYELIFTASDGELTDSETITVTVNNLNRAPVLSPVSNKTVAEGKMLSFSISAHDADNDTLTYSIINLPMGAVFTNQTLNWTPSYEQAGTYEATFMVNDGQLSDNQTITITVLNDEDRDGFADSIEIFIGTNPHERCGYNAWPPNFNNDRVVNILDVLMFKPKLPPNPYDKRYDLNTDGKVDILDVTMMKPYMGKSCK
jgi:beta propeller repeat protein